VVEQEVPYVGTVVEQAYLEQGTSACIVCHYRATLQLNEDVLTCSYSEQLTTYRRQQLQQLCDT
jgi:hypothetical protein